jgi:hypothetical protein
MVMTLFSTPKHWSHILYPHGPLTVEKSTSTNSGYLKLILVHLAPASDQKNLLDILGF